MFVCLSVCVVFMAICGALWVSRETRSREVGNSRTRLPPIPAQRKNEGDKQ